jgi:hypothetical protein
VDTVPPTTGSGIADGNGASFDEMAPIPPVQDGIANGEKAALQDSTPPVGGSGIASGDDAKYHDDLPKPSNHAGIAKGEGASLDDTAPNPVDN